MALSDFNQYFKGIYHDRWDGLFAALQAPSRKVMRLSYPELHLPQVPDSLLSCSDVANSYLFLDKGQYHLSADQLQLFYVMDPASILVAQSLTVTPGMRVLDMCSAPGGKGLVIAEKLKGEGEMFLNELSRDRRERLIHVIRNYVPSTYRPALFVKGKDASLYGLSHPDYFNAILLDAPCSGEQHLVQNEDELNKWTLKRSQRLAQQQYSMLCSALLAAQNAAEIVYSTCSISPLENDGVIEKLIQKKSDFFDIVSCDDNFSLAEKTRYGHLFLPDRAQLGPMYICKLRVKK